MAYKINTIGADWIEDLVLYEGNPDCEHEWIYETDLDGKDFYHRAEDFHKPPPPKPEGWVEGMQDPIDDRCQQKACELCHRIVVIREKIIQTAEETNIETPFEAIKKQIEG